MLKTFALQRLGDGLAAFRPRRLLECLVVGLGTPIEGARHLLHPLADAQVADAHLPQALVHVVEHHVEERLAQLPAGLAALAQPAHHGHHVQHDQVEAAIERVGNPALGVEDRIARLTYRSRVETAGRLTPAPAPLQMAPDAPDRHDGPLTHPGNARSLARLSERRWLP